MKAAMALATVVSASLVLAVPALAGRMADGNYAGSWVRKKDGTAFLTCAYTVAADVLTEWRCGGGGGHAVNISATGGVFRFNPQYKDGKLLGQHELRWNGSALIGRFVTVEGKVTTEGSFTRK